MFPSCFIKDEAMQRPNCIYLHDLVQLMVCHNTSHMNEKDDISFTSFLLQLLWKAQLIRQTRARSL